MRSTIVLVLIFFSAAGCWPCFTEFGINSNQRQEFMNNPCELPCFYDVGIGTTRADAIKTLKEFFGDENVYLLENGNLLACIAEDCEISLSLRVNEQIVEIDEIVIGVAPQRIYCIDYYNLYGPPSLFFNISEYPTWTYLMFYDNLNIEVVLVPSGEQQNITWIENIYIRNTRDYDERRSNMLSLDNIQYLVEFNPSEFCEEPQ